MRQQALLLKERHRWHLRQLDVALRLPESLDLTSLQAPNDGGLQPGEVAMPEEATQAEANSAVNSAAPVPEEALMMLMSMGSGVLNPKPKDRSPKPCSMYRQV